MRLAQDGMRPIYLYAQQSRRSYPTEHVKHIFYLSTGFQVGGPNIIRYFLKNLKGGGYCVKDDEGKAN